MFKAFVIVCAVFGSPQPNDMCFELNDSWGPYVSEEKCQIRTDQMSFDIMEGELNFPTTMLLGFPPMISIDEFCVKTEEQIV